MSSRASSKGQPPSISTLLIDWHLSKFKYELRGGAKRVGCSGTWQLISARLLMNPTAQNEISDDLESVILIMEWMALRFHRHSLSHRQKRLKVHVQQFFEWREEDNETHRDIGGDDKHHQWLNGRRDWALSHSNVMPAFAKLLDSLLILAHNHYLALEARAVQPFQPIKPIFQKSKQVRLAQLPPMQPEKQAAWLEPDRSSAAAVLSGKLCLATHDEIIKVFLQAYQALHGRLAFDKLGDQFSCIGMAREKFSLVEDTKQLKKHTTSD
ncbi:uncharacterized protein LAESUDRAFT_811567 [Laetiporus sulphureus 93-53]|uniref:Fungal-type protein kinase domain-containing protein n=1 Tax=Laetiporus sulphureus 93-53 TaxID=1314785 RepID=A0A165EZU3_9APHY|nr:uncharacterized protein LAESUDRAFT_811567 [Laetiporus sulphureus 93-53]KZT08070.1 hypothetical protein LAESUDRAFT_811567 [Laetiporus sulphureus 93-53]